MSDQNRSRDWRAGVVAAAEVADKFNSVSTHRHRLGDCIAFKLNVRSAPPRINRRRVIEDHAMIRGIVLGVAEMLRVCHDQAAAESALRGAGITRKLAVRAGCEKTDLERIDWKRLRPKNLKKTRASR